MNTKRVWFIHLCDETSVIDERGNEVAAMSGDYETDYMAMANNAKLVAQAPEMASLLAEAVKASQYETEPAWMQRAKELLKSLQPV